MERLFCLSNVYLYSPGCIEHHKLHYSVYAWVFCLRMDKFLLQLDGRFEVNKDLQMFRDVPVT